jgi:uncharacterized protein (TIGR00369 family)
MSKTARTRTYEWSDPLAAAEKGRSLSGLDYLLAINADEIPLPPLSHTLGFGKADVKQGEVTFPFEPQEYHYNTLGMVHGGVITAILDSAMGCTLHSTLPAGVGYVTLELKVNFIKAVTLKDKQLFAQGNIIHAGKTTGVVEAHLRDQLGNTYAHSICTCLIHRQSVNQSTVSQ